MNDSRESMDEEEWVIWNGTHGLVTTVTIGRIEAGTGARTAWLDEPFDMVGPFSFDELETHGRSTFAACVIMSRQRWQDDQVELRRESLKIRRAEQQRINEKFARFSNNHYEYQDNRKPFDEQQHRKTLNLPIDGSLDARQINIALLLFDSWPRRRIPMSGEVTNNSFAFRKHAKSCSSTFHNNTNKVRSCFLLSY